MTILYNRKTGARKILLFVVHCILSIATGFVAILTMADPQGAVEKPGRLPDGGDLLMGVGSCRSLASVAGWLTLFVGIQVC